MCNSIKSILKRKRRLSVGLRVRTTEVKLDSQRQNRRKEDHGGWRRVFSCNVNIQLTSLSAEET